MSISTQNISKLYGSQKAVDEISFSIPQGEVVGFLGPNGAGKTTTMKMISAYLPPSAGKIEVCGMDVVAQSLQVRKTIGYLPEHNPLYLDMYVKEFLAFTAESQGMRNHKSRIAEVIDQTGLEREQAKKIGALSKGYRQRVGLAQAIVHDPKVLILDEPTTGLDPNQIVEIRNLIRSLGAEKTVLLSTHIMQEVQAVCDRVIIINQGKIVADETTKKIQGGQSEKNIYIAEFAEQVDLTKLKQKFPKAEITQVSGNTVRIENSSKQDLRSDIFQFAVDENTSLLGMKLAEENLEDVFRKLTK